MKPLPPPRVPGKTESERFDNALRKVLSVDKSQIAVEQRKPDAPKPKKK